MTDTPHDRLLLATAKIRHAITQGDFHDTKAILELHYTDFLDVVSDREFNYSSVISTTKEFSMNGILVKQGKFK